MTRTFRDTEDAGARPLRPLRLPLLVAAVAVATSALALHPHAAGDARANAVDSLMAGGWAGPSDSSTTVILLLRHAEKNTRMVGHDVPLDDVGERRARALVRVAGEASVSAIYVTPTHRSRDTALPLARALGDSLFEIDAIDETVKRLRENHWGATTMVVGHSNTLPQIIEALTGRKIPGFSGEFDIIYVVTLGRDGRSTITRLRYGEG